MKFKKDWSWRIYEWSEKPHILDLWMLLEKHENGCNETTDSNGINKKV